jgi:2-keto-4-pentenoate hydratase
MTVPIQAAVERLVDARLTHRLAAPLSETYGEFGLAEAYAIQDALRAALEQRGELPIGWKLAATAPVGQQIMGVNEPACGFLPPRRYASGADVSAGDFADLRVEAEVAFRMRSKLAGPGITPSSALAAVEAVLPAFELLDFIYSGTPRAGDYVANSIHGKAIVVGDAPLPVQGLDLALEGVVFEHNGEIVGTHTAAEVLGNPVNALAWLANHLATRGRSLAPRDIVISGGITKLLRPKPGDTICARFTHLGRISMAVVA